MDPLAAPAAPICTHRRRLHSHHDAPDRALGSGRQAAGMRERPGPVGSGARRCAESESLIYLEQQRQAAEVIYHEPPLLRRQPLQLLPTGDPQAIVLVLQAGAERRRNVHAVVGCGSALPFLLEILLMSL